MGLPFRGVKTLFLLIKEPPSPSLNRQPVKSNGQCTRSVAWNAVVSPPYSEGVSNMFDWSPVLPQNWRLGERRIGEKSGLVFKKRPLQEAGF